MNIYDISKTRIKAILRKYDSKTKYNYDAHDLFNWCREYEDWINTNIYGCMTSEMDYILNKSFEDNIFINTCRTLLTVDKLTNIEL